MRETPIPLATMGPNMSPPGPPPNRYEVLFAGAGLPRYPHSGRGSGQVLEAYEPVTGDAAIELPTGTGKTLLGVLAGEQFRQSRGGKVAYLGLDP